MLEVNYIKEKKDQVLKGLLKRNFKDAESIIDEVISLDKQRKEIQYERDNVLAESNNKAKEIGILMKARKKEKTELAKKVAGELKEKSKKLNKNITFVEEQLQSLLYQIPNIPHPTVPKGNTDQDNEIIKETGNIPNLHQDALPHWDLIKKYNIIDFELGNKVTGAGFPFYKGKGARMQRALINFFLEEAIQAGYTEIQPPILINEASAFGTGQLPDKESQMYKAQDDNLYLIPTAEVPITNMYRNVIVKPEQLPIKLTGYTLCFRREAGAWGANVRGLNRLHQFDKVEIIQIQHPEKSYETLEVMSNYIQKLIQKLELPFRVLRLCAGDLGFTSALTFDMEVYSAAQKKWLEVSSVSNFETYQTNRLKLKFKNQNNKTQLLHTLNGSALALPRILASILENNQTPKGIFVPEVLQKYCGFDLIN